METREQQQLRILTNGPDGKEDWEETRYLKEKGFVDAAILIGKGTSTNGKVISLVFKRTTAPGRDYADALRARANLDESNIVTNDKRNKEPNKDNPVPVTVVNKGSNVVNLAYAILAGLVIAAVIWLLKQNGILV